MTEPLALDYYLHNFRFLIDWISKSYTDLLTPEEALFIDKFHQLDDTSQCLLVRLVSRKGPCFRVEKLNYIEIADINSAADKLIASALLAVDPFMDVRACATMLTKPELAVLFHAELHSYKSSRKEILVEILCTNHAGDKPWSEWTGNQFGQLYQVDLAHIINTFLLLFFGNPYQNLSEFVLQDLGLLRYENYTIDEGHRLFANRAEINHYQLLLELREQLETASDLDALQTIIQQLPAKLDHIKMERRRARLCNQLAYQLERLNEHTHALELYCQHQLPPARERQIRLLEKRGDFARAWHLLSELLTNPIDEQERQTAERMAPRLAKKAGVSFIKKPRFSACEVRLNLPQPEDDPCDFICVEERARAYYHNDNEPCFYVENQLFNGLFGLWLWPEMFRSVAGAFANPFQLAPLDMYQEGFQQRRPGIKKLWQLLDSAEHKQHLLEVWTAKQGIANSLVTWQAMDEDLLNLALHCIPPIHLKVIFERLLFDLRNNCSGFPDLIQFFPDRQSYRLIEVKGPGDRIQDNQQRWLEFFAQHAIPAEVCYVCWRNE